MELFTPLEYLKIDIANNSGKSEYHLDSNGSPMTIDKLSYKQRLEWFDNKFKNALWLEKATPDDILLYITDELITPDLPLVFAGLQAYQNYLNNKPSGYLVAFDACSSGIQIMSALTADAKGLALTGCLGNTRSDVYTTAFKRYIALLGSNIKRTRDDVKKAIMTHFYGSKRTPEKVLGKEGIPAFHQLMHELCSGASNLRDLLINSWNKDKDYHAWVNADGHTSYVPVIKEAMTNVNVLGLSLPIKLKLQMKSDNGLSNAANVIHAQDALIVRELVRRCKYEPDKISQILFWLEQAEHVTQDTSASDTNTLLQLGQLGRLIHLYERTEFLTVRICDVITSISDVLHMSNKHRKALKAVLSKIVLYTPFSVICIHDSFKTLPCHMNYVRYWYKEILADMINSHVLQDILNQLIPNPLILHHDSKYRQELSDLVRHDGNYAIT